MSSSPLSLPAPSASSAAAPGTGRQVQAPVHLAAVRPLLLGLNREQRQAVTHRRGPLIVVAGPGTGKTEVVTRRVAWLIAAKLARPREILALTFTDNAASEMQQRVDVLVPYGQADAAIHTFHAFGDRLLRQYAFELGLPGDVRLVTRGEIVTLLREHLFELGLARYLPLGDPTRFLGALADLFGRAKDEDVSVAAFEAHAAGLVAAAGSDSTDPALADLATARGELAMAYRRYCELLARNGLIDHADQIALPLRLLRERPAVRREVVGRYRYLLVDELQDTNRAQLELVFALCGDDGNVMVVGDPDQGIYTFRGAVTGNVARFEAALPAVRRVVLRRNYRSRTPILEASGRLLVQAGGDDSPVRQVAHRRSRRPAPVRCLAFRTPDEEADGIAQAIAERVAGGARPADFAVLVRTNGETDALVRSLRVRGVPAENGCRAGLTSLPAVRELLALVRVVADPSNSLELYALASAEPYRLAGAELGSLLQGSRRRHRSLWQTLCRAADGDGPDELSIDGRRRVRLLVEHVRAAIELAPGRSSGEVVYDYLRRSGTLERLARRDSDGADLQGLRGLARFIELIRARASLLAHDRLPFLAPHLDQLPELAENDGGDGPGEERVAVLTVHRAKGLQFNVVYLAGLVDGRFPVRGRPPLIALPVELRSEVPPEEDQLAEERRLFYVAMTRARDELWLSYHLSGPDGRGHRRPSPFVAEVLDPAVQAAGSVHKRPGADDVSRIENLAAQPSPPAPGVTAADERLSLSFSQVDDYLTCPERYRLRHVIGVPTPAHHALSYGSALHQAVAAFHLRQGQGATMSEPELLAALARSWTPEGFLSREHEEARYAGGQDALRRFREQQLASGIVPVAVERPFRFRLGEDLIVGRIDRIDRTGEGAVITDYKSSDVREEKRAHARARDSLQLQVYALAHEAETGELPAHVQLHFLDSGVIGRVKPDQERLAKARTTLAAVASGVRAGAFEPKPSQFACSYCPFRQICPASAA